MLRPPKTVFAYVIAIVALGAVVLGVAVAASGDGPALVPTPAATPSPMATPTVTATATSIATASPTTSPSPSPLPSTATPSSTPVPPTVTPRPPTSIPPTSTPPAQGAAPAPALSGGLALKPAQIRQGGTAVVYLAETATAATLTFQGRQYPMLNDGARWWAIVGTGALTQPGLYPVSVMYTPSQNAAAVSVTASLSVLDHEFPVEYIELAPSTAALLAPDIVQNELNRRAAIFAGYTVQRLWSGPFVRPARGAFSDVYGGGRSYNGGPVTDYHRGTDFIGDTGAPVVAAARGRVAFTGELQVRGNTVIIDHGAGLFTAYHHLLAIDVAAGQMVNAGERIGAIGSTGLVTGPHLHWEVIVRGVEVDGQLWLQGVEVGP